MTSSSQSLLDHVVRLLPADEDDERIDRLDLDATAQALRDAVSKLDLATARRAGSAWETPIRLALEFAAHVGFAVGEGHWNDALIIRMDGICDAVGVGEDAAHLKSAIAEELARVEKAASRMSRYRPRSVFAQRPNYFYEARDAACWLTAYIIGLRFADPPKGTSSSP